MTQNLWDVIKTVLRGKFIAIQSHLKKQNFQMNNLPLQIKWLERDSKDIKRETESVEGKTS